jgi:hypothetical protein
LSPPTFNAGGGLMAENPTEAASGGLTRFAADFIAYRVKTQYLMNIGTNEWHLLRQQKNRPAWLNAGRKSQENHPLTPAALPKATRRATCYANPFGCRPRAARCSNR